MFSVSEIIYLACSNKGQERSKVQKCQGGVSLKERIVWKSLTKCWCK